MKKVISMAIGCVALFSSMQSMALETGTVKSMTAQYNSGADLYVLVHVGDTYAYYLGNNPAVGSILAGALNSGKTVNISGTMTTPPFEFVTVKGFDY